LEHGVFARIKIYRRTRKKFAGHGASEKSQNPPEVIMLMGQAMVESAIEMMKLGAYDYLIKSFRANLKLGIF